MDYELVKRLKEDGLQWSTVNLFEAKGNEVQTENYPTLEELISAVPKSIGKATSFSAQPIRARSGSPVTSIL